MTEIGSREIVQKLFYGYYGLYFHEFVSDSDQT
jgi:hypothetical protein